MITGYPALIPRYALGNWWDKKDYYNEFDIAHIIKKFEDNNVPISMFILNKWQNDNNFEFNKDFKDVQTIIKYLNSKNIKFGLTISDSKQFINNTNDYKKLKDYLTTDINGNIPFNVYDARSVDAFLKILIHSLNSFGINFYSIDTFNKKELDRLTILKHYLYYNNTKTNNVRPIISSYNTKVASHRYPILYAGESEVSWDTLKKSPEFNA